MASPGDGSLENGEHSPRSNVREQDRFLPIANISRIMKKMLPENAKISKDAKEIMQECVSEFISFITSEASDKCQSEKRKTINGDDLLLAMSTLGFEEYIEPLRLYLTKYREMEGDSKLSAKATDSARKREATGLQDVNQPGTSTQGEIKGDSKLSTKGTNNDGKREATDLQAVNQPGPSTEGESTEGEIKSDNEDLSE